MRKFDPKFAPEENTMKRNVLSPFIFVALLVVVVGLACSLFAPATSPAPEPIIQPTNVQNQPTSAPIQQPTQPQVQQPTEVPPTVAPPASPFFKEEFNNDVLGDWTDFLTVGDSKSDKSKATFAIKNGKLVFTLEDNYLYSYLIYNKQLYEDVRVEVSVDNRGKNNNNVSLICRYSKDGWYEFNIASNGLFNIFAYDATGAVHKGYNAIYTSGSNAIKMGKETNVYVAVCSGKNLSLYINGEKSASVTENKYGFSDGNVGLSVSSFNVYPIIVEFDYFDIQKP
jgi:hypothetical protein